MAPAKNEDAPTEEPTPDQNGAVVDVPVFAPAEEPTPESEVTQQITIPDWLAENYRQIITDPDRNDSYTKLAERSEGQLAAWARQQAAAAGEDVNPVDAEPAGPDATREEAAGA